MKTKKNNGVDKFSIYVNLLALILIFYDVFVNFKKSGDQDILFVFYFLSFIYIVCFIHLFHYDDIKDKIKLVIMDLFPIFLFGLIVAISEESKLNGIIESTGRIVFTFYLGGGLVLFLLHVIIFYLYKKIRKFSKND